MKIAKKVQDVKGREVRIVFEGGNSVKLALNELSAEMLERAALHGLSQKLGDVFAGAVEKGGIDPVAWAEAQVVAVRNSILGGVWNVGRDSTGGILAEALFNRAESAGQELTLADCQTRVAAMTEEQTKALRKALAVEIKVIELERAKNRPASSEIDFDEMFSE